MMSNNNEITTIGIRGIQFRRKIEAQWMYVFEKLEWNWEYVPLDLEGYNIQFDEDEILIEIEGDSNIWRNYKEHKERIIKTGWIKPFAILGGVHKTSENWQDNNFPIIARIVLL